MPDSPPKHRFPGRPLAAFAALVVSFALGAVIFGDPGRPAAGDPSEADAAIGLAVAMQRAWFPPIREYRTDGEPLAAERFDALMTALDQAMTADETLADFERETEVHLWNFVRRIASPVLTEEQERRAMAYMRELRERHPEHGDLLSDREMMVETYCSASYPSPSLGGPAFTVAGTSLGDRDWFSKGGEPFTNGEVDELLASLDALLTIPETVDDFSAEAPMYFSAFGHRIQQGRLSAEQTARIVAYFDTVQEEHPDADDLLDGERHKIEYLTPGRVAPNIVGTDTDGVEFALEEYRGNIVVLIFSGQWCGPCRFQYPYHRAMLDLYEDRPVVLLGVNSDAELETIRRAKDDEGLDYRTWWDGHGEEPTRGPIATAWSIFGWPNTYILDEFGTIRYVSRMSGELIVAVDRLLGEKEMRDHEARLAEQAETDAGG